MNDADNPISTLAEVIAHAKYVGFSDIEYEDRDWQHYRDTGEHKGVSKTRRPTERDFEVFAMFTQTWGSTALGHGGMGASAMTTAYTTVLYCARTREFLVYFGGQYCYTVIRDGGEGLTTFMTHINERRLEAKRMRHIYNVI